jgi:hypothetical protein
MDHPVVARRRADRHRRAGDARAAIDRAHIAGQQAGAALRFVDGGDAAGGQAVDHGRIGPLDVLHDDTRHGPAIGNLHIFLAPDFLAPDMEPAASAKCNVWRVA